MRNDDDERVVREMIRVLTNMGCTCGDGMVFLAIPVTKEGVVAEEGSFFSSHKADCPILSNSEGHMAEQQDVEMLESVLEQHNRRAAAPFN